MPQEASSSKLEHKRHLLPVGCQALREMLGKRFKASVAGRNAACSQDGNFHRFSNLSATGACRTHFCITRAYAPNASRSVSSGPDPAKRKKAERRQKSASSNQPERSPPQSPDTFPSLTLDRQTGPGRLIDFLLFAVIQVQASIERFTGLDGQKRFNSRISGAIRRGVGKRRTAKPRSASPPSRNSKPPAAPMSSSSSARTSAARLPGRTIVSGFNNKKFYRMQGAHPD
jgi:hypothetical protein